MELTSFCTAKEMINKTKRQPIEWEKVFVNNALEQGLNFQNIQTAHTTQQQQQQKTNPIQKWAENLSRPFSREEIQMTNRRMQRCATSLITRDTKVRTQGGITSHLSGRPSPKAREVTNAVADVEKGEPLLHYWWEHKLVQPPQKPI